MSKAFTKDDDASSATVRRPPPRADGAKRPVTPESHARFRDELDRLIAERPDAPQGTPQRTELESRIAWMQALLESVVPTEPVRGDAARFGAWVELEDEERERVVYRLVGPDEADAKAGLISIESPLGRALLGREEGDEVVVERPRGRATFEVLRVSYAPLTAKR